MYTNRNQRLYDLWEQMYGTNKVMDIDGITTVHSDTANLIFDTQADFVEWLEKEVREALLIYALNDELGELVESNTLESIIDDLNNIGGCGADADSWSDGWDKAIDEAIRIVDNYR